MSRRTIVICDLMCAMLNCDDSIQTVNACARGTPWDQEIDDEIARWTKDREKLRIRIMKYIAALTEDEKEFVHKNCEPNWSKNARALNIEPAWLN